MNEYATYINVLTTSLRKKVSILEKLVKVTDEEEVLLKKEGVTIEEIEEKEQEKGKYLESLELADEGFEKVFQRIKDEFEENKYQQEEEIKTMQTLIKKITDMTVKIQAQEVRNKQLMEFFFQQKKRDIRSFHNSKRTVNQYQQNMVNRNVNGQAYFLDSKR